MNPRRTRPLQAALIAGFFMLAAALLSACASVSVTSHSPGATGTLAAILNRGTIVVGTAGNMPPLNMIDKQGQLFGFEVDMAEDIANGLGVTLKWVSLPFAQLLPALEQGDVDMILSGMTITMQRNRSVAFVGPYLVSGKAFLTKIETIAAAKDTDRLNSPKTTLTALQDSTSAAFISEVIPNARLVETENYAQSIQLVLNDTVQAMVADYPICAVTVFRNPGKGLLSVFTPFTYEPLGIGVRASDPHLINWLENFLKIYEGTGRLDTLEAKWFQDGAWLTQLP